MDKNLQYRRQFLLAKAPVPLLDHWQRLSFAEYHLYTHPDLEVCSLSDGRRHLVLIGYLFDAAHAEKGNSEILGDISARARSLDELLLRIKRYAGRYAFLYKDQSRCVVLHDALALREVYYCTTPNLVVCGSQPNLLAKYSSPAIGISTDSELLEFHAKHLRGCSWVGDQTYYEHVKHLLPNHCLDLQNLLAFRYWPNEPIKPLPLDEAVRRACEFLQGTMHAVTHRYRVMMAVTAGTDTRTLLAASRHLRDNIHFFINKERDLNDRSPDIRVPRAMFRELGIPFHVHTVSPEVDSHFKEVFLGNTFFASERILPTIYNVYFKEHSDKVNILGIGEIGRTRWGKEPRTLNSYRLAYALGYKDSNYVRRICREVLAEVLPVGRRFGINVMTLVYWEQRLGNWGAVGNSESDIAIEEFDPFDSHSLYETLLGVDEKWSKYSRPTVFREMILHMWPELLNWPVNPPGTLRDGVAWLLKRCGLYGALREAKYQANYMRYRWLADCADYHYG